MAWLGLENLDAVQPLNGQTYNGQYQEQRISYFDVCSTFEARLLEAFGALNVKGQPKVHVLLAACHREGLRSDCGGGNGVRGRRKDEEGPRDMG